MACFPAKETASGEPCLPDMDNPASKIPPLELIDWYWRAANYLSVGQIYLHSNPLLREPLRREHIKARLVGHWGTTPGLNFIWAHCNRVIARYGIEMMFVCGPGHGGPALVANTWLEGTYTERYPHVTRDALGMATLFKQFSLPGGIPSHVSAKIPGSLQEGGELGYSLLHAYGAAFDNPDLTVCCVIGDGEAETGALAASWHSNKFLHPTRDGSVIPVLHLNGYKVSGPTVLARISKEELRSLLKGYGYVPYFVEGHDPGQMHLKMARAFDKIIRTSRQLRAKAKSGEDAELHALPMIVLRTPKGWTGPKVVDGLRIEGSFRSHQLPLLIDGNPEHLQQLEAWLKSYRPELLFTDSGAPCENVLATVPRQGMRMGENPHANGGLLLRELSLPDFKRYAIPVAEPGHPTAESTTVFGSMLRDVMKQNMSSFRLVSPDETASNHLGAVFDVTDRALLGLHLPSDDHVSPDGRVMEILSEHCCQGWLEGYLQSGRHGLFSSHEAFIHIVDSMFNQYANWLRECAHIPWRRPIASLNYLLTCHDGFSHRDPGFLDHVANKNANVVRIYLPPDANCLLSVADHCLRSRNCVNVIVAGKHPAPQYLDIEASAEHCRSGIGAWKWASNETSGDPDVVLACAGDVPTMETLAAADLLMEHVPGLRFRVVNVVDLLALQAPPQHPHGLPDQQFDALFTRDRPVIFAFHGYPKLIHASTYRRSNHANFHVHGYKEEGATTTPFDMAVLNQLDRYHLALDAVRRSAERPARDRFEKIVDQLLAKHRAYVAEHGEDMPEIREWKWRNPILEHADERVEEASEESFPASDAPASWSGIESNR